MITLQLIINSPTVATGLRLRSFAGNGSRKDSRTGQPLTVTDADGVFLVCSYSV